MDLIFLRLRHFSTLPKRFILSLTGLLLSVLSNLSLYLLFSRACDQADSPLRGRNATDCSAFIFVSEPSRMIYTKLGTVTF